VQGAVPSRGTCAWNESAVVAEVAEASFPVPFCPRP